MEYTFEVIHIAVWQQAGLRARVSDCTMAGPFLRFLFFYCLAPSMYVISAAYLRHLVWSFLQQVVGTGQTHLMRKEERPQASPEDT